MNFRGQEARCHNVGRFWTASGATAVCTFSSSTFYVHVWGPCIPLKGTTSSLAPLRNVLLTPQMQAFNSSMSSVRSCMEWLFGDIVNFFQFIDFKES